jgi:hypothetical protein
MDHPLCMSPLAKQHRSKQGAFPMTSEANPTITSYNASAVKKYNANNYIARLKNKQFLLI